MFTIIKIWTTKTIKMKKILFNTDSNNWASTFARVALGSVMFAHGAQKLLGWFGGYGFKGTMGYFTGTVGLPWIVGLLVIIIEFFGALSLIFGFATRLWSFAMAILTLGILQTSHAQYGFFMNWAGDQKGEGIEYFVLMLGLAVSLIISGAGKYSIDALMATERRAEFFHFHHLKPSNQKA
jgi:putative oxidoreductase